MMESNSEKEVHSSPSKFKFKEKPPSPKRKLNSKTVIIATGIFSVLSAVVITLAFSGAEMPVRKVASTVRDAMPADTIRELPADYAELARRRPKEKIEAAEVRAQARPQEISAEEKYRRELKLQKLKRAMEARQSDVSFKTIRLDGSASNASTPGTLPGLGAAAGLPGPGSLGEGAGLNPRDLDSRQDEKREFLEKNRAGSVVLSQGLRAPLSPFEVKAGSVVPGVLLTGINSDLPGQLLGQVSQNVYDSVSGNYLLIPQGTKIIGTYDSKVVYGQERVLVVWTRLIYPNGNSISLEGMPGVDMSGYAGLSDSVNNHYLKLITGVVLGSLLGAGAQIAQGANSAEPNFAQLAAQGAAKNINEVGQEITRKNLSIQPTLEIAPGFRFNVFVTKDMILEPYEG